MNTKFSRSTLFLLTILVYSGCQDEPLEKSIRPVRAIKVGDVAGLNATSFPGRARATEQVNSSFRVPGELVALPINVGTIVKQGDVLARLDQRDFKAALDSAEANLQRAQAQLEAMQVARPEEIRRLEAEQREAEASLTLALEQHRRNLELVKTGAVTQAAVDRTNAAQLRSAAIRDQAIESLRIAREGARIEDIKAHEAEIKSLEANLMKRKNDLEYTTLTAPFDGTIAAKYIENYQTVAVGKTVCRLLDTSRIEIVIDVPESKISLIDYVEDIVCVFDAFPDVEFKNVEVKEIGTEASATTRTYPVTLIMDQPEATVGVKILPGMAGRVYGSARLPEEVATTGFVIPETALFEGTDGKKYVWLIDASTHKVQRSQPITSWDSTSLGIRVNQLEAGQWIAVAGVHFINEGQEVKILGDLETNTSASDPPPTSTSAEPTPTAEVDE